jgi:CrcB protein
MWKEIGLVGIGAGTGGILRYLINLTLHSTKFPLATLIINLSGSLVLGVIAGIWAKDHPLRLLLGVGLLGGYTTFSTFSLDLIQQLKKGEWAPMLTNLLVQTVGSVILCGIGLALAERFSQTNH